MRVKVLLLTLLVAGLASPLALAEGPPPGRDHPGVSSAGPSCTAIALVGTVASVGDASFTLDVKEASGLGRLLAGHQVAVAVDAETKLYRRGPAKLSDLAVGDRVAVAARACLAGEGKPPAVTAKSVEAKPAAGEGASGHAGAPPRESGSSPSEKPAAECKGVHLSGVVASVGDGSFTLKDGTVIAVNGDTRFADRSHDLAVGDLVGVNARACRSADGKPSLLAKEVVVKSRDSGGEKPAPECRSFHIAGVVDSVGDGSFALRVGSDTLTVAVNDQTRISGKGKDSLADLRAGDRVRVEGKACRGADGKPALLAKEIEAKAGGESGTAGGGDRKGGSDKPAAECRRGHVVLKGVLVSVGADSFVMEVKLANEHGRALAGKKVTVLVYDKTKISREGEASLSDLKPGDRIGVVARLCKGAEAAEPKLLAKRVVAHPPKAEGESGGSAPPPSGATPAPAPQPTP